MSRKRKPTSEQVFKRLYDGGVQLRIGADGRLKASHASGDGVREEERKTIRAHAKGLAALLCDVATADRFSPALTYVGEQLQGLPEDRTSESTRLLNAADDAYGRGDNGEARWMLLCAAEEARQTRRVYDEVSTDEQEVMT